MKKILVLIVGISLFFFIDVISIGPEFFVLNSGEKIDAKMSWREGDLFILTTDSGKISIHKNNINWPETQQYRIEKSKEIMRSRPRNIVEPSSNRSNNIKGNSAISDFEQSVPEDVEKRIRQIYTEKYPDNFSMQKILIDEQLASYRLIKRWTNESGVPQNVFNKVKEIYAQKYPYNYSMQKTLILEQCNSYRFLQSYTAEPGIPKNVISDLKQKYEKNYPYNYSMQKTLVENQVKSYIDIHR